jgi:formylglycine-generating enzyme required for sulfatase activity
MAIGTFLIARGRGDVARCAEGFEARGARCIPLDCPSPLAHGPRGCDAPDLRVTIPLTKLLVGPSDWEAEGRVPARTLAVDSFAIDAFEVTTARYHGTTLEDGARAASGITYHEAQEFCRTHGGRLPTEDEWIAAAARHDASNSPRRYPWGDTGAVCRRAAWGLANGPCAAGGTGADTVGAHPSGATALGVHDLAGNVAEWVSVPTEAAVAGVRGGSWRTALASDLRTWARRELAKSTRADDVGFRCAYDVPRLASPPSP